MCAINFKVALFFRSHCNDPSLFFFFKNAYIPVTGWATDSFLGMKSCAEEESSSELNANLSHFFCFRQKMFLS